MDSLKLELLKSIMETYVPTSVFLGIRGLKVLIFH